MQAHGRKRLEQLCRAITQPALSDERVQRNAAGQVEVTLKTPWRNGTTHLVMSPLECMQRLAALVPCPPVLPCGLEWDSRLRDSYTAKRPGS